jgi:hypothetical protein
MEHIACGGNVNMHTSFVEYPKRRDHLGHLGEEGMMV